MRGMIFGWLWLALEAWGTIPKPWETYEVGDDNFHMQEVEIRSVGVARLVMRFDLAPAIGHFLHWKL
jgi:hypothetical protein